METYYVCYKSRAITWIHIEHILTKQNDSCLCMDFSISKQQLSMCIFQNFWQFSIKRTQLFNYLYNELDSKIKFPSELKYFPGRNSLPRDSKLFLSNVFLILIVISVLEADYQIFILTYYPKHPMVLPKNYEFTNQVIMYYLLTNLNTGLQLRLSLIRQKFWFVDGV